MVGAPTVIGAAKAQDPEESKRRNETSVGIETHISNKLRELKLVPGVPVHRSFKPASDRIYFSLANPISDQAALAFQAE